MKRAALERAIRRAIPRAFALFAALALLVGIARANARYFYCPMTGTFASASCCSEPQRSEEQSTIRETDCCEARRVTGMPEGAVATSQGVPDAPLVAYLTPIAASPRTEPPRSHVRHANAQRAGPPPSPGEARTRTMVFLI